MDMDREEEEEDVLAQLGVSRFDAETGLDQSNLGLRKDRDHRVCICGHAAGAHAEAYTPSGPVANCTPGKQQCPCVEARYVAQAQNLRNFMRKTEGRAQNHALLLGIMKSLREHQKVSWLVPVQCDFCSGPNPFPVPISLDGRILMDRPGAYNKFMCDTCYRGVMASGGRFA